MTDSHSARIMKAQGRALGVRWLAVAAFAAMAGGLPPLAGAQPAAVVVAAPPSADLSKSALYDLITTPAGLFAVGERGLVLRSADDGKTWQAAAALSDRALVSIAFSDANIGVAVGHGGTVLRSTDGGATWAKLTVAEAGTESFLGVTALRNGHMLAYGAFGLFVESTDRGATWKHRKVLPNDSDRHIAKILELDDRLLLVGESATLASSTDGGASWQALAPPYEGSLFGALKLRGGGVLMHGMRGSVFRSDDKGLTWVRVPLPTTVAINGGTVGPDGRIALVGNNGFAAISTDNGRSFGVERTAQRAPLAQAVFAADGALLYVGYLSSGRIARATKAMP